MDPGSWTRTQNNLGNTLFSLGSLAGDPKRVEEAIAAFRNVLKVLTHEDMPADWASTQNSLGITLRSLGDPLADIARNAVPDEIWAWRATELAERKARETCGTFV
jgi:hypothetical protein